MIERTDMTEADRGSATPVLVLGMHRGGTSALAGVLHLLGFDLGPSLMQASEGVNNKGFWEHLDVFAIHERLFAALGRSRFDPREMPVGWREHPAFHSAVDEVRALVERDFAAIPFWAVKDPRMCRVAPVWLAALRQLDLAPRVMLIVRHPAEVARSMQAQHWSASTARTHLCWLQHMLEAEQSTRGVARTLITYDTLLANWRPEFERMGRDLDIEWPEIPAGCDAEIDAFLDGRERHFDESAASANPDLPSLAAELFEACRTHGAQADVWQRFAAIGETFRCGAQAFGPCLDEAIVEASLAHFEIGESRRSASHAAGQATLADLGAAMTDLLDVRLSPLRDVGTKTADRLETIDTNLHDLSARLARFETVIAAQPTTGDVLDRLRTLGETLTTLQQNVSAMASESTDLSRRHIDDARVLRESIAQLGHELERLRAALDARFSLRRLFGGNPT